MDLSNHEELYKTQEMINKINWYIATYFASFTIILGILGNIISIAVFYRPKFRDSVTSFLFRFLAILDLLTLLSSTVLRSIQVWFDVPVLVHQNGHVEFYTLSLMYQKQFQLGH